MGCGDPRYIMWKILQDLVLKVKKPRIKVTNNSKVWLGSAQGKKKESAFFPTSKNKIILKNELVVVVEETLT